MKIILSIVLLSLMLCAVPNLFAADKYAGEIFYLAPSVSNQAMGNTGYTNEDAISATWWNPALLALKGANGLELMHAEQFEGLMQFNHLSAILGRQNRIGLVITHIGIDDIGLTRLANDSLPPSTTNRPVVWKHTNNNDLMAFFGISRSISERLHLGITPKLAYRSLAEKSGYGFGADLGMLWQMNTELRLGLVAKDFFSTQVIWENGTQESVLPSLDAELGWRTAVSKQQIPVLVSLAIETQTDGRTEAAAFSTGFLSCDIHAGIAVLPIPQLKVMAGYDADNVTAGLGIYIKKLAVEYAFKNGSQDELGYSQRISAGWRW
jgi:hypothetical protein